MIFDSHAHYDDEQFAKDRDALLKNLKNQGVGYVVDVAAELGSIPQIIELTKQYDFVYGTAGVHPESVQELTDKNIHMIIDALKEEKIVAVGEIGLDYHRKGYDKELQKHWFRVQLDIAREHHLPVVIHSRDAAQDTLDFMREWKAWEVGGVIHCYAYGTDLAKQFTDMGFYIGIGGVLTFSNAKKLKEVAEEIPLENIVLETDCPYLAPEPYRGKRNNSAYISYVAEALAQIKSCPVEQVISVTEENAKKLYQIG